MTLSLAFLSPALVKSAIDGTLPYGVGITQFIEPPLDWNDQLYPVSLIRTRVPIGAIRWTLT